MDKQMVEKGYALAKAAYAALGVDTDAVMEKLKKLQISLHCWQGDDVGGFEKGVGQDERITTGGLMATGDSPGKATTPDQLRSDILAVLKQLPGRHKVSIHTMYGESDDGKPFDRADCGKEKFANWLQWAKENNTGLDMNSTFFWRWAVGTRVFPFGCQ